MTKTVAYRLLSLLLLALSTSKVTKARSKGKRSESQQRTRVCTGMLSQLAEPVTTPSWQHLIFALKAVVQTNLPAGLSSESSVRTV